MLAIAGAFAREQRGSDRLRRSQRGDFVRNDEAHHLRTSGFVVGLDRGEPGERLDHRIVDALFDIRSLLAEAADRNVDEIWFEAPQLGLADTHPFGAAGP